MYASNHKYHLKLLRIESNFDFMGFNYIILILNLELVIFSKLQEMGNPELVQMCLAQLMKSTLMLM